MRWIGRDGAVRDDVDNEVHDCVGKEGDYETDDRVEDGVFCVGDFFRVAAGNDVAEAAIDEHNDRDDTDCGEDESC